MDLGRFAGLPSRKIYGFYSKDSLQYLLLQRNQKVALNTLESRENIHENRYYQVEAIRRVTERFSDFHRKALIVQATGTGKTRVAIAISELPYPSWLGKASSVFV